MIQFKKGMWLKKANYGMFTDGKPVTQVKSCNWTKPKKEGEEKLIIINGKNFFKPESLVEITEGEAENLLKLFDSLQISESIGTGMSTSCFRDDSGKPKQGFKEAKQALKVLFKFQVTRPNDNFEAYKCDTCNQYHIGKRPSDEVLSNHVNDESKDFDNIMRKNLGGTAGWMWTWNGYCRFAKYDIVPVYKKGEVTYRLMKINSDGKKRTEITPDKELIDELVKKIENKEYIMICRLQWWQRAIKQIKMFFIR